MADEMLLRVSRQVAKEKLSERIQLGRDYLGKPAGRGITVEDLKGEGDSWVRYNIDLLKQMFVDDATAEEYRNLHARQGGRIITPMSSPHERSLTALQDQQKRLRTDIDWLGGLVGRLELYAELAPAASLDTYPDHAEGRMATIDTRNVFVVHGRDDDARDGLFTFLRSIDLHPLEWGELVAKVGKGSPYIGEILDSAFSEARAVVVLLTPDDEAQLRKELRRPTDPDFESTMRGQARPNVLFEAGMAFGRDPDRTILVEAGELRPFSDVFGRHVVRLDNSVANRQALADRLETAGCAVRKHGTDWHRAGNLQPRE